AVVARAPPGEALPLAGAAAYVGVELGVAVDAGERRRPHHLPALRAGTRVELVERPAVEHVQQLLEEPPDRIGRGSRNGNRLHEVFLLRRQRWMIVELGRCCTIGPALCLRALARTRWRSHEPLLIVKGFVLVLPASIAKGT